MCGIVGYIGKRKAYPILIKGLKRLEYRGYDSAGVAIISDDQQLNVYKTKGKVSDLENFVTQKDISGTIGIAHTRWATHGEPCSANAHPHYSSSEKLALIHNGIIENYAVLKEKLQAKGYVFKSSTDTEVLVQLIEYIQVTNHIDLLTAVQLALQEVIGAYAIAVLDKDNPDGIIAARKSSPLVVGIGEGEFFLASDATPIVEYTDKVVYLEDEEIALICRGEKLKVVNLKNVECPHEVKTVALNLGQLEKGGYPHFMLKEIFEQPGCIHDCMRGRINVEGTNVVLSAVIDYKKRLLAAKRFVIVACGTSWHAALIGKHLIESFCRIPVEVEYASEFRYRDPLVDGNSLAIVISQSGETSDTLAALREAKRLGSRTLAVTNVVGSSIAREADQVVYTYAGPEIAVASTKAYTTQLLAMLMLAIYVGRLRGSMSAEREQELVQGLTFVPEQIHKMLENVDQIKVFAREYGSSEDAFFLGGSLDYAVALEGALKLKEISYIHAEAYAAGELKHGTISLITENMPVIAVATQKALKEKTISNIKEVKARGARVILVCRESDSVDPEAVDIRFDLPEFDDLLMPMIAVVPLQLIAYYTSVLKGNDVDKPRNLAKSVTVE